MKAYQHLWGKKYKLKLQSEILWSFDPKDIVKYDINKWFHIMLYYLDLHFQANWHMKLCIYQLLFYVKFYEYLNKGIL